MWAELLELSDLGELGNGAGGWDKVPKSPQNTALGKESPGKTPQGQPQGRGWGRSSSQVPFPAFLGGNFGSEAAPGLWLCDLQGLLLVWEGDGPAPFLGPSQEGPEFPWKSAGNEGGVHGK